MGQSIQLRCLSQLSFDRGSVRSISQQLLDRGMWAGSGDIDSRAHDEPAALLVLDPRYRGTGTPVAEFCLPIVFFRARPPVGSRLES